MSGRFWIKNDFIRKYAKELSVYEQMVYVTLCCHANKEGHTIIGCRRIASNLGINKDTANKALNRLEVAGFIGRLKGGKGRASQIKVHTVPLEATKLSQAIRPKDYNKELYKEEMNNKIKRMRDELASYKGR
ncbi:helix-turn-helix domain-containing protein [Patescibacteria group bacterium]